MTERFGNPSGGFGATAASGLSNLPLDWEHPTPWSQLERYFEPVFKESTKKIVSLLMENAKSLEDFLAGTVYKINGGSLYGNVSVSGTLTVDGVQYYAFPTGSIMPYAGTGSAPTGWLYCDGTAYQESQYAPLFLALGSTYNTHCGASAPASGYFRVPNYSGRVLVGRNASDSTFDSVTDYGGEKTHTLTASEMPSHTHGYSDPAFNLKPMENVVDANVLYAYSTGSSITAPAGGDQPHNNLQPYAVANYIIKY